MKKSLKMCLAILFSFALMINTVSVSAEISEYENNKDFTIVESEQNFDEIQSTGIDNSQNMDDFDVLNLNEDVEATEKNSLEDINQDVTETSKEEKEQEITESEQDNTSNIILVDEQNKEEITEKIPAEEVTSEEVTTEETKEEITDNIEETTESAEEETVNMPEFSGLRIVDGVMVLVSAPEGVFPEGSTLSVNKVTDVEQQLVDNAVDRTRDNDVNVVASYTYNIKVIDKDGNEIQPADEQKVKVSFSPEEAGNENLTADVYHVTEENGVLSAEALATSEQCQIVIAESDGFSYYTVEFTYGDLQYVMNGDTSIPLSDILDYVGLTGEVSAVYVSDEGLFSASNENGEWMITANQAFSSTEWMRVTIDGVRYEIEVTDATSVTISSPGYKNLVFNLGTEYTFTTSNLRLAYNVSTGTSVSFDSSGSTGCTGTIDSNGNLTIVSGTDSHGPYSLNGYNAWKLDWRNTNPGFAYFYRTNISVDPTYTAPTARTMTYNGSAQSLVNAGSVSSGGTMEYALGTSDTTVPTTGWSTTAPSATNASNNYYVWWRINETSGYNAVAASCLTSIINKKPITITAKAQTVTYGTSITTGTGQVTASLASGDSLTAITLTPSTNNVTTNGTITPSAATIKNGNTDVTSNYSITYNTGNLTINKANLTVTAKPKTITYGSAPANDGVTYSGFKGSDSASSLSGTLSYTYTYSQYGNVGNTYKITPGGLTSSNYNISYVQGTLTVNQKEVGLTWSNTSLTYNGSSQAPTATVTGLVNGDSISVTVTGGQTNVGNYTATASSLTGTKAGNYKLPTSNTHSFSISNATMTGVSATGYSGTYDATSHSINVTKPDGATVKYRTSSSGDYNLTTNPTYTDAGTYTVYYQVSKSNYTTVTGSATVEIAKRNITLTSGSADKTYDKTALTNDNITVTGDGYASGEGATYNVTGSQTDAGSSANTFTYTLSSGTKADNYNITKTEGTLTVNKKEIGLTWGDTVFTYNGQEQAPTATATGLINGDDCTVTVTGGMTNASNSAYTATASSLSNGNYELPSANTTTFTIGKKAVTVTAKDQSVVLNNSIAQGASQAILTGVVNGHTLTDITLTSSSTAAVTTDGTITPSDAVIKNGNTDVTSNYNISYANGTLTVTKGAPTYTAPEAYDLTYNGDDQELVSSGTTSHGTITYSDSEDGTYTATIPTGKDAGPYDVWWKLTGDDNHADIEPAKITVTINKKAVTVTGIAASDKTYNGNTTAVLTYDNVTFAGKLANDTLTVTATGAFEDANAGTNKTVNISNLTLAGASADNYKLAANGHQATATATINPLPVTVTITGNNATAIYDGNAHNISGYVAVADTNLYDESSNFTFSGTAQASQTNAGTAYMGLASDHFTNTNANFDVTFNVTDGYQTVEPAPVTLTANSDTTLIYNESEQTVEGFTCSVDGLTFDGVSASGTGTDVGSYDVTFTGVSLNETRDTTGNYIVTDTVKGTLKISKTDGELTVTPKTLVYNGGEQEFVAPDTSHGTIYYALGDDDVTPPSDDEWSTEIPEGKNHDTYYVWYKLKGDDNHNDTEPACVPVTINKKEIIIKPDDLIKHINKDDPEFTYDVTDVNGGTGLEDGDVLQGLIINKEPGEEPGIYTITVTVDPTLNDNYEINATATATFTITDHIFTSEPTFIWTDDYKDCSAEFTCDYDDGEKKVVQSEIKSREEDGVTYVYAQITVDGVTYISEDVAICHDDETQTDDDGNEFNTRIVIKSGFDEIEESLVDMGYDSEEKILEAMLKTVVTKEDKAASDENIETVSELYDVELQISYDGGDTWEPATIDNFPKNGLEVVLPYPDGTDMKTNNFNIYHMFAYDMGGHKAGEVEAPAATKTSNGIKFKVMGLSPIYITWTKAVTGVKLDKESVTLDKENATAKLSGIVEPADAAVKDLVWTSSDEKVAIVDEYGNVTAVGKGICIITATSKDGSFTATCKVEVNIPEDEKKEETVTPAEVTPAEVTPVQTQNVNKAPDTGDRAPVKETIILMISSFLAGVYLTVKQRSRYKLF